MTRTALATGASNGLGPPVALPLAMDGIRIIVRDVSNREVAERTGREQRPEETHGQYCRWPGACRKAGRVPRKSRSGPSVNESVGVFVSTICSTHRASLKYHSGTS